MNDRGGWIETDRLDALGENMARSLSQNGKRSGRAASRGILRALRALSGSHAQLSRRYGDGEPAPAAAQWLLDNWYLAQREGHAAAAELRASGRLSATAEGPLLLVLADSLLRAGKGGLDAERCEAFLLGYQRISALSPRELSLFPTALRAAAVIALAEWYRSGAPERPADRPAALFGTLRLLGTLDLSPVLERADRVEQLLRQDPAGIYPAMDEKTRNAYRRRVSQLAKKCHIPEYLAAERALRLAADGKGKMRHVGYFLFTRPLDGRPPKRTGSLYIAAVVLSTLTASLLAGFLLQSAAAALLLLLPFSQLCKSLLDFCILRLMPPRHLPRMELRDGVPGEGRTLCVVSALITGPECGPKLARRLEEFYLCNRDCGKNLLFGVLADLPESRSPLPEGAEEWLSAAGKALEELNLRYGGGFFLLTRGRVQSPDTGLYMGWERKRGAIMELARLLCGESSGMELRAGNRLGLRGVRYILTLDADTRLSPGSARELIGAMLHPLNTPVLDEKRARVVAGHAIVHPRMSVSLSASMRSDFARVFAGQGGTDPYGCDAGEIYMDLCESGGFAGKGILDAGILLRCLEKRIPENHVLSHDALEGAYLRGAWMGDVELTDGFPSGVLSYYRRLHRWVRGDWQNLPWIGRRGRDLPDIERWRLLDSLRRSLVPPATLLGILAGLFLPSSAMRWTAAIALFSMLSHFLMALASTAFRSEQDVRQRLLSPVLHGLSAGLIRTLLLLLFLPFEACVCLSAALTALWRMVVSHKNMLQWQTAAQSDAMSGTAACLRSMWPAVVIGLGCLVLCPSIPGRALGAVWALSPFAAAALGKPLRTKAALNGQDRAYLLRCAAEIWRYFDKFCTPGDHFLPPDNFQERPPVGCAHRCSPTNLGLCLLSALCAADLELESPEKALGLIENVLSTMERMPKWNGHLYNWYDTRTLKSLRPMYVSTVDSGNLAGCLIVLREGLLEYNRTDLAERADALLRAMDFRPLYDERRRLFHIGIEPESGKCTEGWYDLLASEARLAGYVAVSLGQVPRKHWRRLGRAQVQCDGFRGMASWTGTMFEYLMPELCLPLYRGSLLYESARFCLYVQKKRTSSKGLPWGISESAFFALDPALSYRYKAHGCARLALQRGMDAELVVSPYSSFLALSLEPRAAVKNLRSLEAFGARGPWGFWEAVDFTPSRCRTERGLVVRCVMAHHLGMSMVSIANCLQNDICRRRFLRDPAMAAHRGLLQEKLPIGGVLLRRSGREAFEKPSSRGLGPWSRQGEGTDFVNPCATLLSNGVYSVVVTESGLSLPLAGAILPYRAPRSPLDDSMRGLSLYLRTGDAVIPLLPEPGGQGQAQFHWEFTGCSAVLHRRDERLVCSMETWVPPAEVGELREIRLRPVRGELSCELLCLFEPVLAREDEYVNHIAFTRLGLHTSRRENALLVQRAPRGGRPAAWLCAACSADAEFSTDGFSFPARGGLSGDFPENTGWQSEALVVLRVPLRLREDSESSLRLALSIGAGAEGALESARNMLKEPRPTTALPVAAAGLLGMSATEVDTTMSMIKSLVFPHICTAGSGLTAPLGREGLWKHGISGDMPIVCCEAKNDEQLPLAEAMLRRHALLHTCGLPFDLVFLTDDGGDYRRPRYSALSAALRRLDRDAFIGIPGGIHFVSADDDLRCLSASAVLVFGGENADREPERTTQGICMPGSPLSALPAQKPTEFRFEPDGAFRFSVNRSMPPRAWGNILTNGILSYNALDAGTGAVWYKNARECPITPWVGDPSAVSGPETLELSLDGERFSLFASPSDTDCQVRFEPGTAVWEKSVHGVHCRLTAFVTQDTDARVFLIETDAPERARLRWCAPLQLAPSPEDAPQCVLHFEDGLLRACNPRAAFPEVCVSACLSRDAEAIYTDRLRFLRGAEGGVSLRAGEPCLAAVLPASGTTVLVLGCAEPAELRALCDEKAARAALERARAWWRDRVGRLEVSTPCPALDHLLNGWCACQAIACRCLARSSVYQSGGAIGFRDQLQDYVNLIPFDPDAARAHILCCCAHQFEEGDVQHWWHPGVGGTDRGVRTRCSDDLIWLPWALCEYVESTGDTSVCSEQVGFLSSPPLAPEESSRYETPSRSALSEDVLGHCRRALELVLSRGAGPDGLLLMGSGDWNDGFDRVGEQGRGTSVWLSWFFSSVARSFGELLSSLGQSDAKRWEEAAARYGRAADNAWDGSWYLRGRFDDGSPLGGKEGRACRIDSIAQSFASLCPEASPEKKRAALDAALAQLPEPEAPLIRLFTPPFLPDSLPDPGYIASYGPGFRENGGQYTHGAVWLAMACFRESRPEDGWRILRTLLPGERENAVYGAEPFVLPADVYANPDCPGRAGWSWYTGSAGWFLRVALRELLGFRLVRGKPVLEPQLPPDWQGFSARFTDSHGHVWHFGVKNGKKFLN